MNISEVAKEAQTLEDDLKDGPHFESAKRVKEMIDKLSTRLNDLCQSIDRKKKRRKVCLVTIKCRWNNKIN